MAELINSSDIVIQMILYFGKNTLEKNFPFFPSLNAPYVCVIVAQVVYMVPLFSHSINS